MLTNNMTARSSEQTNTQVQMANGMFLGNFTDTIENAKVC